MCSSDLNNKLENIVLCFGQDEMENMEEILLNELHNNINIWFNLFQEQRSKQPLLFRPTKEMSYQWKYTGQIEEIYNRIAAPIGKSKRASLEEFKEYL